jgi:hypothetical protein
MEEQWSPEIARPERTAAKGMKVCSLDDNSRKEPSGGYFSLNEYGNAATLNFCYVLAGS